MLYTFFSHFSQHTLIVFGLVLCVCDTINKSTKKVVRPFEKPFDGNLYADCRQQIQFAYDFCDRI